MPWVSGLIVLVGIYFVGKAWDIKKKQK